MFLVHAVTRKVKNTTSEKSTLKYVYVSREIRNGKYRHVFINKTGFSITVHVKSAATTKKKELSLNGALCKTVVLYMLKLRH